MQLKKFEIQLQSARPESAVLLVLPPPEDAKREALFDKLFGSRKAAVLALDPEPMILLATELLDKADTRNGEQSWVFGYYAIWCTTRQWTEDIAPKLRGGSTDAGHLWNEQWQPSLGTVVWCGLASSSGLDDPNGSPSAAIYMKVNQPEVREAVKMALALGTLRREFPMSLRIYLEADVDTKQVKRYIDAEDWGLDFVRKGGVKTAKARQALALNDKEGDPEMEIKFVDKAAMLADKDVQDEIRRQAEVMAADPARVKAVVLSAPIEALKDRPDLKPLLERQTRAEVLASVKPEELAVVLKDHPDLEAAAVKLCSESAEATKKFREEVAKPILLAAKLDPELVTRTLAAHDFAHRDSKRVEQLAETLKLSLGLQDDGVRGDSAKAGDAETVKTAEAKAAQEQRDAEVAARRARI